jgi:hypothetical protein
MARRGFFAEMQHQSRLAAREREREARQTYRNHLGALRDSERAQREADRAAVRAAKSADSDRKRLEKEAKEAYVAAMEARASEQTEQLIQIYDDIDNLLATTLTVDDFVDLTSLRVIVKHPAFDRPDLEQPTPLAASEPAPTEPVLELPPQPTGLAAFFSKRKWEDAVTEQKRLHEVAIGEWRRACQVSRANHQKQLDDHTKAEAKRSERLKEERERYQRECSAREEEAAEHNKKLVELIANLGYGTEEAVQEYVAIVLSNSAYPEHFAVAHEPAFDSSTAELALKVTVPAPEGISSIKSYKYARADDAIVAISLSQKECRDRYANAVFQVAIRSLHEIFESDRRALIKTISLEVGANAMDRATGQPTYVPFVIASADRESFLKFDLSEVVPALTLERLGASISKNPFGLVAAKRAGVRRS